MAINMYVGNLSYDTNEDGLRTLFAEYGEVESARVITDRYSGRSKGFGFVEMTTEEAAQKAIEGLNGKSVEELGKLRAMSRGAHYAGRGGPQVPAANQSDAPQFMAPVKYFDKPAAEAQNTEDK